MPLPTVIADLNTTASLNYPAGTDSPAVLDDVQRAHASFIAQLRDANTGINTGDNATNTQYSGLAASKANAGPLASSGITGAAASGANTDITSLSGTALADFYKKANILGTVSQTAGVPTGAVIERGSNANGEYVRFADGTQICKQTYTGVLTPAAYAGLTGLYSATVALTFPAAFIAVPASSAGGVDSSTTGWASESGSSTTVANLRYYSSSASVSSSDIRVIAVGRWF